MNSSSAIIATGVMSFQLNGMPVASGVVNRFDSVMTSLCGLPLAFLTSRKPSPPAPPALLMTTIDCFIRPCLVMMPCMVRAIWSAPPPGPAGTMISTVRVGSHAASAAANGSAHSINAAPSARVFSDLTWPFPLCLPALFADRG